MNKLRKIAVSVFTLISCFVAQAQTQNLNVPVYLQENAKLDDRVEDALSRMTLEEKVALCHAQSKFSVAGVSRLGIPEIWMSDGPHGVREEISWDSWAPAGFTNDSCTAFPALTCLAATWEPKLALKYGKAIGEEARYRKKSVLLGPGVNIYRTPLNGRNFEYMGEDPYLASIMVVPYIHGVQSNGVAACVKHYILNNQEKWRGHIDVDLSDRALYEIYFPAFKAAVEEGHVWSIMGSYNKLRGEHACHNNFLLNKVLKGDWKFDGAVITDWGGCHDTDEAVNNGLDIEMGTYTNGLTTESKFTYSEYYLANPYLNGLKSGKYSIDVLNDKARRVLRLIMRTAMNTNRPWGSLATKAHAQVGYEVGVNGVVLLKNERTNDKTKLLPLDASKYARILVVGENATRKLTKGGGSSELKVKYECSPLEALQKMYGDKIIYAQGYESGRPRYDGQDEIAPEVQNKLHDEAIAKAKTADLVLYFGGLNKNHFQDCEDSDRKSYNLSFGQDRLISDLQKSNSNIVVTLLSGNAVAMPWLDKVPAVIQGWYNGSEAGHVLADIISGKQNPSGHLPFSFPKTLEDSPAHSFGPLAYPGDSIKEEYKEGIYVGYRWYTTKKIKTLFPFGYGLSYTTFEFGKPNLSSHSLSGHEKLILTVPVTNTGDVDGKELVQIYVGQKHPLLDRPTFELKHFKKVHLAVGETKKVQFEITADDLKYYDDTKKEWRVDADKFTIYVGKSTEDIQSKLTFHYKN